MLTRTTHIAIEVLGALALGLAVVVAGLGWRLSQGPLSLAFLKPYLEQALDDSESPFRLTVGEPELIWSGWNRPIDLRATDVKLRDREGAVLATVPQMSLKLSVRALPRGMVAPTAIELLGARATVIRDADGAFRLALGPPGTGNDDMLGRIAAVLLAPPDRSRALGYLRRVSIVGARLDVEDRQLGLAWSAPRADAIFTRDRSGIRVDAGLSLALGGAEARLNATASYRRADGTTEAETRFSGVRPASLAARFPHLAALAPVELPLSGTVDAAFDKAGALVAGRFDVTAGAGEVVAPSLWTAPLDVAQAHVRGTLARGPDRLTVEEGTVALGGGPQLGITGTATRKDGATVAEANVTLADVPFDAMARYWPQGVAHGARNWIAANMSGGSLAEGHAALALRLAGPDGALALDKMSGAFRIAGTTVHFLRPLPPVTGVDATGTFDANDVTIKGASGRLAGLGIDEATVKFAHIERKVADASVEVVVRGPLRDALELLDHPRFRYMKKLGIDPKGVAGATAARLVVTFPTALALKFGDVGIRAAANLRGVAIRNVVLGRDLSDGNLALRLDKDGMDVSGKARVAGVPADLVWVENFDPKARIARRYRLTATLTDADRDRLGFSAAPYATGPMEADLALMQPATGPSELQLRLGLDRATLALPALGWSKPAGGQAAASLIATLAGGQLADIRQFAISGGGLDAFGRLALAPDGKTVTRAELDRFHLGRTELAGTVTRRPQGGYDARFAGPALDAVPLVRRLRQPGGETSLPPLGIAFKVDTLNLLAAAPLTAAAGAFAYDGQRWTRATLDGAMPGGHRIALRYGPTKGGTRATLDSDDAGETLRALGIYDNIQSGRFRLEGERPDRADAAWTGMLRMQDFRLLNAPALARVLTVASLTGIGNLLSGKGVSFARLVMPFTFKDGRLVIDKARAAGSELGLTAEGALDFDRNTVKVNGTIVPAYTLNSVLGNIPILGPILTGGEGSGVFAATYHLDGKLDEPAVKVNPLAALAPGFLRDLVEGLTSGGTNVPMPMPENIP